MGLTPAKKPHSSRADRRRNDEAIASAAARLLAGEPGASIQAIADAAGVSRQAVYRRFPTREALEAVVRMFTINGVMQALDGFTGWTEGPASFEGLLHGLLGVGRTYPVALSRHQISHAPGPVDKRMITLLEEGQDAGALRSDVGPEFLNAAVLGILSAACDVGLDEAMLPPQVVIDMVLKATRAGD